MLQPAPCWVFGTTSHTYTACSSSSPPMRWDMFFSTPMLPETSSNCSSCCSTISWGQREGKQAITGLPPAAGSEPGNPADRHWLLSQHQLWDLDRARPAGTRSAFLRNAGEVTAAGRPPWHDIPATAGCGLPAALQPRTATPRPFPAKATRESQTSASPLPAAGTRPGKRSPRHAAANKELT